MTDTFKILLTAISTGSSLIVLDIIRNTYRSKRYSNGNKNTERRSECLIHKTQVESLEKALVAITGDLKSSIKEVVKDVKNIKDIHLLTIITNQTRNEQNIKINYRQLQGILKKLDMPYPGNGG